MTLATEDSPVSRPEVAVSMPCVLWAETVPDVGSLCRRVVLAALDRASSEVPLDRAEISLVLADDAMVQGLNRQYRGQDRPTNVLSFAALDEDDSPAPGDGPVLLGDVVLAYETAAAEAAADGKTLGDHLSHLLVHGTLHLLGYDHSDEAEAVEMEGLERKALADLGIKDPYAAESETADGNCCALRAPMERIELK
jgi:probable rRNA maturation factor